MKLFLFLSLPCIGPRLFREQIAANLEVKVRNTKWLIGHDDGLAPNHVFHRTGNVSLKARDWQTRIYPRGSPGVMVNEVLYPRLANPPLPPCW
jgi:hypothetical protein